MSNKFDQFQAKYPHLFKEYPRSGFDLSPGWETLVDTLCQILEPHIDRLPEEARVITYCAQLKEKFGTVRFYMTAQDEYISGAIAVMEAMSAHVCDTCGMPGKLRTVGWYRTLCDEHHQEREHKRQEEEKKWALTNQELECLEEEAEEEWS